MKIQDFPHLAKFSIRYPVHFNQLIRDKIRAYFRYQWAIKNKEKDNKVPPPLIYKLYLNQACDLRCKMCFLWGENGIYTSEKAHLPKELDWKIVERIFKETGKYHPTFILSGGEPLLYSHFGKLANLLKEYRSCAYICTNGGFIDKHLNVIKNNPYLIFYVSIDGTKEINDSLRGKGVYEKAVNNIKRLKSLGPSHYVGAQFTLQPENVGTLYETCKEMIKIGVDWIIINLRWHLNEKQVREYEQQLQNDFGVTAWNHKGYIDPYPLNTAEYVNQYRKIRESRLPIYISSCLKAPEDINLFVNDPYKNPYNDFCYKQWIRMDVLSNGEVTPCMPYPDLTFNNLSEKSVEEIWNGAKYQEFRQYRRKKSLAVCSQCDCLYLYDKSRIKL